MVFKYLLTSAAMQIILTEIVFIVVIIILDRYQSAQVFHEDVMRCFISSDI